MSDDGPDVEFDPDHGVYRAQFDWADAEPLSTTVVTVVGAVAEATPTELAPLHYDIDPDALDRLFSPRPDGTARSGGRLTFEFAEHAVTVDADGEITVTPP